MGLPGYPIVIETDAVVGFSVRRNVLWSVISSLRIVDPGYDSVKSERDDRNVRRLQHERPVIAVSGPLRNISQTHGERRAAGYSQMGDLR